MASTSLASLLFPQAATLWLDSRSDLHNNSRKTYRAFFGPLTVFFGHLTLAEIEIGHIRVYEKERLAGRIDGYGKADNNTVNREIGAVKQIMSPTGEWERLKPWYHRLPQLRARRGRALSSEEKEHLFAVAERKSRWLVAGCCAVITANTTAGAGEIRHLRLQDIDIKETTVEGRLTIVGFIHLREGLKNPYRERRIPLNADALPAVQRLLQRALRLGCLSPDHYLLPKLTKSGYDPSQPQGEWKSAWASLRKAAGMKDLRYNELRHTAITMILEDPTVSDQTAMAIAGHISRDNFKVYSHTRQSQMVNAVNALSLTKSDGTNVIALSPGKKLPCPTTDTRSLPENSPPQPCPTSLAFGASTFSFAVGFPKK